jgi:hypothetical protein
MHQAYVAGPGSGRIKERPVKMLETITVIIKTVKLCSNKLNAEIPIRKMQHEE